MNITVRTGYSEYKKTYYSEKFEIIEEMPIIGEVFRHDEEVTKIQERGLDPEERKGEAWNYEYFYVDTEDEAGEEYTYNVAVPKKVLYPQEYEELEKKQREREEKSMKMITKRMLSMESVREFCIRNDFYTRGTNEEYALMLSRCNNDNCTDNDLIDIAKDIFIHSDLAWYDGYVDKEVFEHILSGLINNCIVTNVQVTDFLIFKTANEL